MKEAHETASAAHTTEHEAAVQEVRHVTLALALALALRYPSPSPTLPEP
jgi:hypothetical protein